MTCDRCCISLAIRTSHSSVYNAVKARTLVDPGDNKSRKTRRPTSGRTSVYSPPIVQLHPIVQVIRDALIATGLSQREIARRAFMAQSHLSDVLSGRQQNVTLWTVDRLAEIAQVSISVVSNREITRDTFDHSTN